MAASAACAVVSSTSGLAHAQTGQPRPAAELTRSPSSGSDGTPPREYGLWSSRYRSPGLAVALSLTPLPVDFGNLYAENLSWGIAYTAVEVSLLAPMMWFAGDHMGHGGDGGRSWSDGDRAAMIALISGYAVVKIASGIHAGYAAKEFNQQGAALGYMTVLPLRRGATLQLVRAF